MEYTSQTVWLKNFVEEGIPDVTAFEIRTSKVSTANMKNGDVLVKILAMSVDPHLRLMMMSKYHPGKSGQFPFDGFVAGKVLESRNEAWEKGDLFGASLPFSTVQVVPYEKDKTMMWKLTNYIDESEISLGVGALGMPGCTAWAGLIKILRPNPGETLFVSAASGAVGGMVGQLARIHGVKTVIGSCGGPEKGKFIKEKFGYDYAIDYKTLDTSASDKGKAELIKRLGECAPDGIDMYFENVAGIHFDAAYHSLRDHGRIAICGSASTYNQNNPQTNEIIVHRMIRSCHRIEGFIYTEYLAEGSFLPQMAEWIKDGKLKVEETFVDGIENWPSALLSLFTGNHTGKLVVRI